MDARAPLPELSIEPPIHHDRPPRFWLSVTGIIAIFMTLALIWASLAMVDEVSRAEGRVIPSGKTQVIQNGVSGVVSQILVRVGQQVKKGEILARLDDTSTASSAGEVRTKVWALEAQVARLRIESAGKAAEGYVCPDDVRQAAPDVCKNEQSLLEVRAANLAQGKGVLGQRVEQKQGDLNQALSNQTRLKDSLGLANKNLDLLAPLAKKNLVSQTEYIASQRDVADLQGQLQAITDAVGGLRAALSEAQLQVNQADLQFREQALSDLTQHLADLASAQQALNGAADQVTRTEIRSPVDGIVNELAVNTIGAFVNAGSRLMDIVPVSEKLQVEARLKPSDVAFVVPGQKATIKLTAYDFSIFGGLAGAVQTVSADSIVDPNTRETYYVVLLTTDKSSIQYHGETLPILPGMVTDVEIVTGNKTVLQYLLKPINKAWTDALRER
ncbi:MAG TPA: HlyD family type I secretion periplasmic adaptor subunit [Devosiaceae bacterium]|nr:HlyD family type I secretion periplasmic adaptor subunit [Devosiaceae bacterium]